MHLSEISIYPVKSCRGLQLESTRLDRFGPAGDRRWMVVTPGGEMLTQRQVREMALVEVTPLAGGLRLGDTITGQEVGYPEDDGTSVSVRIWGDQVAARDAGDAAADWLEARLGQACRLVYMPTDSIRRVDGAYAREGETVGFADGFPLLLISQASLDDLNRRLETPVPMNRFRPNLVVAGTDPFAEDQWRRIRIGATAFDLAKPCSRCAIPSIIQETAGRDPQINRTLAGFRRVNGQILFGQNLLYRTPGVLNVGDPVEILD